MFNKKNKKASAREDDATQMDSAADLAQAFIDDMRGSGGASGDSDRTEIGSRTYTMKVHNPAWATFWSLMIWGAGFVYIRKPILGIFTFLALFVFHILFFSLSGIFPDRVALAFLSDIGWQLPRVESLWILASLLTLLWSLNLIIPTLLALRSLPGIFSPRKHWYTEAFSFVPVLGFYLNGRFRWGHISAIAFFICFVSYAALTRFWNWGSVLESNELRGLEFYFNTMSILFILPALFVTGLLFRALAEFLSSLGVLKDSQKAHTDWKFVVLGLLIALFFLSFRVTGQSGRRFRISLQEKALICEEKNLFLCRKGLEGSHHLLERWDQKVREFYSLL